MDATTIEKKALNLPLADRAKLAQRLLLSLEELSESEVEEAWLHEAERRAREIDEGLVQLISSEEVSRKARELIGNKL
jgi:putative addiction module component (TIGR02574 family)